MKKKITLIIILIILILLSIFIFINKSNSNFNFYTKTFKINELSENAYIEIDNLRITLRKICLNEMTTDDLKDLNLEEVTIDNIIKDYGHQKINLFLQIETIDKTSYFESSFAYQILDNKYNNLASEINFNPDFSNKLDKALIKRENFNSKDDSFGNYFTNLDYGKKIIQDNGNSVLWYIHTSPSPENLEENQLELDLSKLKILISNINYMDSNRNSITSTNNIYEFIVEN